MGFLKFYYRKIIARKDFWLSLRDGKEKTVHIQQRISVSYLVSCVNTPNIGRGMMSQVNVKPYLP